MIATIIIFSIVGSIIVYLKDNGWIGIDRIFSGLLGGIVGALIGMFVSISIGHTIERFYYKYDHEYKHECEQTELVAIEDSFGVKGRFFLASGSIDLKPYYVFYRQEGGGFKPDKIPVEIPTIHEEEREGGLIKVCHKEFKGWLKYFGWPPEGEKYEIFVPEGTIKDAYSLDLE